MREGIEMRYQHIIEIQAKEWLDKANGNSYFSANVYIDDDLVAELPFQYGYGDHYVDMAFREIGSNKLQELCKLKSVVNWKEYWGLCRQHNIKLITFKQENCKKKDL